MAQLFFQDTLTHWWSRHSAILYPPPYELQRVEIVTSKPVFEQLVNKKISFTRVEIDKNMVTRLTRSLRFLAYRVAAFVSYLIANFAGIAYHSAGVIYHTGRLIKSLIVFQKDEIRVSQVKAWESARQLATHVIACSIHLLVLASVVGFLKLGSYYETWDCTPSRVAAELRDQFGIVGSDGKLLPIPKHDMETLDSSGLYAKLIARHEAKVLTKIRKIQMHLPKELKLNACYPPNIDLIYRKLSDEKIISALGGKKVAMKHQQKLYLLDHTIRKLRMLCDTWINLRFFYFCDKDHHRPDDFYKLPNFFFSNNVVIHAFRGNDSLASFKESIKRQPRPQIQAQVRSFTPPQAEIKATSLNSLDGKFRDCPSVLDDNIDRNGATELYRTFRQKVIKDEKARQLYDLPLWYTQKDVDKKFRELCATVHPDKVPPHLKAEATLLFTYVASAREALK